ncbi:MbtH family protein [Oceanobacillus sp. ISL-73]|nr:MbtH family protein [Oceanobacillus sp. ISL-74]MBT2652254.1 MbtH family protein [Oceanobacillus sp. ISL-73]
MMTNPFENKDGNYYVLINDEGQYSLWPDFIQIPEGWDIAYGPEGLTNCQNYIEDNWEDLLPTSLKKKKLSIF